MNQSLTKQILVASFLSALSIIAVIGMLWYFSTSQVKQHLEDIRDRFEITKLLHTMADASRMRALSTHRMLLMDDLFERFEEQDTFLGHANMFMTARDKLLNHPAFNAQDKLAWEEASEMVNKGGVLHSNVVGYLIEENNSQAVEILKRKSKQVQDNFINKFNEILAVKNAEVYSIVKQTETLNNKYISILIVVGFVSIILIVLVFINSYKYIVNSERTLRIAHELEKNENEYKTEFLARASHELRTPLNAILGFAQVINMDKENNLSKEHAMYFKHIEQSGWQLLSLVDNILDISRICEGKIDLKISEVNLHGLMEQCSNSLSTLADGHKVTCKYNVEDIDSIQTDKARLNQIMENLASNAIKYNHPGGSVFVNIARSDNDKVIILVSNTGPGIAAENLNMLFKPFATVGGINKEDGRGIGLVLTKALVECLNGSISVESKPGIETVFRVELPIKYTNENKLFQPLVKKLA